MATWMWIAAIILATAAEASPTPSPAPSDRPKPGPGFLVLSKPDRAHEREKVMVWASFLAKARCNQAIKNAREEERLPSPHISCVGSDCDETRCIGGTCYTDEAGASTKYLKICQEGRINLPVGTPVKIAKDADECGESMIRVALSGKWSGDPGCVEPENVTDRR